MRNPYSSILIGLFLVASLLFFFSSKGGKIVDFSERNLAREAISSIFIEKFGFKAIKCPEYTKSLIKSKNLTTDCYLSKQKPESLLRNLSEELKSIASERLGWRENLGSRNSNYIMHGGKYGFLLSIDAPGLFPEMYNDPLVNGCESFIEVILGEGDV